MRVLTTHQGFKRLTFKALPGRVVTEDTGYDDAGSVVYRVIGSKHIDARLQADALRAHFHYDHCTHEWDCCGCYSQYARVKPIGRGVFSVLIRGSRNY